jgi:DNA-binding GntR family transcriptional regulator
VFTTPIPTRATGSATGLRRAQAYEVIRSLIVKGELLQGTVITEAELVRRLGMSRTPVREALRQLQAEGYLWPAEGRGYAIPVLGEDDLRDLYTVRASLEGLAAEHAAARLTRMDLARLEDLYDTMQAAQSRRDDDELAQLNSQFHDAVAVASGNRYLQGMLGQIQDAFERFRLTALAQPGRREQAHLEHGELIAALRDRDPERARELASAHVLHALELRRALSEQHVPEDML